MKKILSIMLTAILLLSTISFKVFAADPKVSIIIPVYNTPENLLRNCLNSAKNQTLKDIEIICVDDESTNGSGEILDEYAKSDPRFKVVHQKNGGTCVARNKGLELAKGEYVQFLDHDDTINPTMSEKCYNKAKYHDADMVCCKGYGCYEGMPLRNIAKTVVWNGIYKTKFLNDNKIRFKGFKGHGEDYIFNFIVFINKVNVVHLSEKLYNHIINENSLSVKVTGKDVVILYARKLHQLYVDLKNDGYFNDKTNKINYLYLFLFMSCTHGKFIPGKLFLNSIDPDLLQDDVINQLPAREKIQLKMMMYCADPKTNSQKPLDDGIYTISSKLDPNMCLDINRCSKDDKANLQLWQKNGTNAQKFQVQYNSDGYYTIKAMCSGKFIDVSSSGKQKGANIWQYQGNGTDAQKWFIVPDGEGYYFLLPKCNNLCMDDSSMKAKNGANIHCWDVHGGDSQRFKFEKCEYKPDSNKPAEVEKNAGKPGLSKPNRARKPAGKPRTNKPVKIKKNAEKLGDSEKSA